MKYYIYLWFIVLKVNFCTGNKSSDKCDVVLTDSGGFISAPENLDQSFACWTIKAPVNKFIRLRSLVMDMDYSDLVYDQQCAHSFLILLNSMYLTGPTTGGRFCNRMEVNVISSGNYLTVILNDYTKGKTISKRNKFLLQYQFENVQDCPDNYLWCPGGRCFSRDHICDGVADCYFDEFSCNTTSQCGEMVPHDENTGLITSHRHFNHSVYPPNLSCTWQIKAPPGKYIRLSSDLFDLFYYNAECSDHVLVILSKIEGPFCGQTGIDLVANTSVIFIKFNTDGVHQGMGFRIRYQFQNHSDCGSNFIKCRNNHCIPTSKVCDTFDDCKDGSDEINCNFDNDFDHPWLLMSNESSLELKSVQHRNSNVSIGLYNMKIGRGLSMNYGDSSIFWTDDENTTIRYNTVNITNGKVEKISMKIIGDENVNEVVIDWILGNIYWISEQKIKVSNSKGEFKRSLISGQTGYPISLKIDSDRGFIFWGGAGSESSVDRITMDGNLNFHVVVAYENVYYPGGLTLDLQNKQIYWTDPSLGQIHRCNYDGSNRKLVISTIFPQPYRIAISGDTIYWTAYLSGDMYKCNKDNGRNYRRLKTTGVKNLQIFDSNFLVAADKKKEKEEDLHPCHKDNGGCSQLCLLAPYPTNYSCGCGDGFMLLKKKSCIKDPCSLIPYFSCQCYKGSYFSKDAPSHYFKGIADALIVTEVCGAHSITLDDKYTMVNLRENNGTDVPGYPDFDPLENIIYWTEGVIDPVIRKSPFGVAGRSQILLKEKEEIWLSGIAVGWITRMLYWCVFSSRTIKGKSLAGDGTQVQVAKSYFPIVSIGIDPFNGHIYWSIWEPEPAIYRSGVIGKRTDLYIKAPILKQPYSLSVDYMNGKLYWLNEETIYSRDLDAILSSHGYIVTKSQKVTALHYFGNIAYVAFANRVDAYDTKSDRWTGTQGSPPSLSSGFLSLNGIKAVKLKSKDVTPNCPEYARCWGSNGHWECLNDSMICDGNPTCFGGIDEFFCDRCSDVNCSQGVLGLHCEPLSEPLMVEPGLSDFLNWDSHPFAKFTTLKDFISSECSLYLRYKEHFTELINDTKQIETPLASSIHVLRQIMKAKIFRNADIIETLELSGKSLVENIYEDTFTAYKLITDLSISSTKLSYLNEESFWNMSSIKDFNISNNRIKFIGENVLQPFENLEVIDMRGNDIKLTSDIFKMNQKLKIIYSDSYSFCCIQPKSVEACYAPIYDVSSCTDLIQDAVLRIFLWLVAIFAFVGNVGVLIKRLLIDKRQTGTFNIFVNNLSLSDALMGLYLLIIAVHDAMFRGHYAWSEYDWRNSILCKISGMLSLMSSEASVWFIFLITVDRFLAVKYPIGGKRMTKTISRMISLCFWIFAVVLAVIPVFPYPEFYSTSGICIALPITSYFQDGLTYSVVLFLGVNFALFCMLGIGQILIFREILISATKTKRQLTQNEKSVAYMLAWVVMTDFFCWIPIGIMVVLALSGVYIPRGVYAWIVVFVLPINSAINPFIYTFAGVIKTKIAKYRSSRGSQDGQSKSINSSETQRSNLSNNTNVTSRI